MTTLKILIADDDPELRTWLRTVLSHEGVAIHEVESGLELLGVLTAQGPFDLVIADVRMSWATGLQALSMARGSGFEVPFVIMTAHADESVQHAARRLGAALLLKPFTVHELLDTANAALARRRSTASG